MDRRSFIRNAAVTGAVAVGLSEYGTSLLSRALGRKPADPRKFPVRPPGALAEDEFLSRCIRCQRCSDACPNQAIVPLDDSMGAQRRTTPHIEPRKQACMLCNRVEGEYLKCGEVCPTGALQRVHKDVDEIRRLVHMGTAEIDTALCYSYNKWSCGACYRACPLPGVAMKVGMWEQPEIIADACIGCGLCERACIRYPQAVRVKPPGVA